MIPKSNIGRARVGAGLPVSEAARLIERTAWSWRLIELARRKPSPRERQIIEAFFNRCDLFDADGFAVKGPRR